MRHITQQQIEGILQLVYSTNIPAHQFDTLRKMLTELPECPHKEVKEVVK